MTAKWIFKVSEVECVRAEEYGLPYDAMATFKIVDGELHVVRAFSKVAFTAADYAELEAKIKEMGFTHYTMSRRSGNRGDGKPQLKNVVRRVR